MQAIMDWLMTGINIVLEGPLLAAVIAIMSVFLMLQSHMAVIQQNNEIMKEYTEYNQYDNTHVYPQDVTAAIMTYRGFPAVKVKCSKSAVASGDIWSESSAATEYKAARINERIDQNVLYDADIEKNPNGEIVSMTFFACDHGSHCGGR